MHIKNAVILTGGEAPPKKIVENIAGSIFSNSFIIAADSGLVCARDYNLTVDLLLGDFDSLAADADTSCVKSIKKFPSYKDFTDTELAVMEAAEKSSENIILIGGNGGRFDHLLSIRSLYERRMQIPYPHMWFCGSNLVLCLDSSKKSAVTITGLGDNDYISLFPLFLYGLEPALISQGLQWDVSNLSWSTCGGSVSNKAKKTDSGTETVTLSVSCGRFLVILPLYEESSFKVFL